MTKGRPPSAKTLVDRQLGRNIKNPIIPADESYIVPNHSGIADHPEAKGTFLKLDGSNANQNIDIGAYELQCENLTVGTNEVNPNFNLKIWGDIGHANGGLSVVDSFYGYGTKQTPASIEGINVNLTTGDFISWGDFWINYFSEGDVYIADPSEGARGDVGIGVSYFLGVPRAKLHVVGDCRFGGYSANYAEIGTTGDITTTGTIQGANYKSGDGSQGITQSETSVTDFDIVIKDGLITSFTKNN